MCATERKTMKKKLSGSNPFLNRWTRRVLAAGAGLVFALGMTRAVSAQAGPRIIVSGTVTSPEGGPLPGVAVSVQGTEARAVTGVNGKYVAVLLLMKREAPV